MNKEKVCVVCAGTGIVIESMISYRKIVDCEMCCGTGYRTWIDELRRPYQKDVGEWGSRGM